MTKGQVDYAVRKAIAEFDKWNDVTGVYQNNTGYYAEIISTIEDAVHIGIQMAIYGNIKKDKEGAIVHRFDDK